MFTWRRLIRLIRFGIFRKVVPQTAFSQKRYTEQFLWFFLVNTEKLDCFSQNRNNRNYLLLCQKHYITVCCEEAT